MTHIVSVLYPRGSFDFGYFLNKHMPLAERIWSKYGMTWSATRYDALDSPCFVQTILFWESLEAFLEARQAEGAQEIMSDVSNYTDTKPQIIGGEVIGKGQNL